MYSAYKYSPPFLLPYNGHRLDSNSQQSRNITCDRRVGLKLASTDHQHKPGVYRSIRDEKRFSSRHERIVPVEKRTPRRMVVGMRNSIFASKYPFLPSTTELIAKSVFLFVFLHRTNLALL